MKQKQEHDQRKKLLSCLGSYTKSKTPSLEQFDELNTLSLITKPDDHIMPAELEEAFTKFIDTLYDYRVERAGTHYVEQLIRSNDSKTESNITLASITGLNTYVVNTLIRQMLIEKMNALSEERLRDNSGEYIEQQVF
ncbi:hypothetical protein LTQ03_15695 [Vibrio splendidus]|uniref:hypothetical protein n=1 Tax=Vibrio splendidus TaxID=29497 RepID=UPI001FB55D5C|nr:hypothetical protein [Vibrio splendidus]UOE82172.1 hypothetical protein LTQ03_15695 [Vibrio splendidus]